jgi:molybdenum cofactor cytidylyltransferase
MIDSVRAGLIASPSSAAGVLLCLADHPLVLSDTIRTLILEQSAAPDRIVIPVHAGRRGHPALFPRQLIGRVLDPGTTLRDVTREHADRLRLVEVDDVGIVLDLDTREDYEAAGRIAARRS